MFKVLVVDDDQELVSAVKELLERNDYEVITAFSGSEAIEKYLESPDINVALLDLVMPMMDETADSCIENVASSRIPVLNCIG